MSRSTWWAGGTIVEGPRSIAPGRDVTALCTLRSVRMADDRWWKDLDAVLAAMLPRGSRILDVGCGDGGLVDRLTELGFDSIGVDRRAPAHSRLVQAPVEHATGLGEFDAITATMALHHADLADVLHAINGHLRPEGRLFVSEFA